MEDGQMRALRYDERSEGDQLAAEPRFAPAEETAPSLERLAEMQRAQREAERGDDQRHQRGRARSSACQRSHERESDAELREHEHEREWRMGFRRAHVVGVCGFEIGAERALRDVACGWKRDRGVR